MNRDSRLYDIISHLAQGEPVKATNLFQNVLGERIEQKVRQFASKQKINEQHDK